MQVEAPYRPSMSAIDRSLPEKPFYDTGNKSKRMTQACMIAVWEKQRARYRATDKRASLCVVAALTRLFHVKQSGN